MYSETDTVANWTLLLASLNPKCFQANWQLSTPPPPFEADKKKNDIKNSSDVSIQGTIV